MARRWRLNPRAVPTVPVRLIPGHPLAQGLFALIVPGSLYGLTNITRLASTQLSGTAPLGGSFAGPGLAWGAAAAESRIDLPDQPAPPVFTLVALIQTGAVQGESIATYQEGTAAGSTTYDRTLGLSNSGVPQIYVYSTVPAGASAPAALSVGQVADIAGWYDGANLWCALNGAIGSPAPASSAYSGYTDAYLNVGYSLNDGASAGILTHTLIRFAAYHRALPLPQIEWLAAEPFSMFEPLAQRTFVYFPSSVLVALKAYFSINSDLLSTQTSDETPLLDSLGNGTQEQAFGSASLEWLARIATESTTNSEALGKQVILDSAFAESLTRAIQNEIPQNEWTSAQKITDTSQSEALGKGASQGDAVLDSLGAQTSHEDAFAEYKLGGISREQVLSDWLGTQYIGLEGFGSTGLEWLSAQVSRDSPYSDWLAPQTSYDRIYQDIKTGSSAQANLGLDDLRSSASQEITSLEWGQSGRAIELESLEIISSATSHDTAGLEVQVTLTSLMGFGALPIESLVGALHLENAPFDLLGPLVVYFGKGVTLPPFVRGTSLAAFTRGVTLP